MSYILHFTATDGEMGNVGSHSRSEYIVFVDGDLTDDELKEQKEDTVPGFECVAVIDLEVDTDLSSLPTERALISSL